MINESFHLRANLLRAMSGVALRYGVGIGKVVGGSCWLMEPCMGRSTIYLDLRVILGINSVPLYIIPHLSF